ncbi:hypothetical protein D3A96_01065 [Robertkochia marina]|nr:hypothetical protein D3A96_01065 [Robertkochia marina]
MYRKEDMLKTNGLLNGEGVKIETFLAAETTIQIKNSIKSFIFSGTYRLSINCQYLPMKEKNYINSAFHRKNIAFYLYL